MTLARMRWWDLPELLAVEEQLFPGEPWSEALFWSELAQRDTRWYVVERDEEGALLAYAGLCVIVDEAWVQTIGVAPQAQGRGLGTALLRALLREAAFRGATSCLLEVRADNDVAQSLYRDHGFVEIGLRRGYYQPSGTDAVVMQADDLTPWKGTRG